MKMGGRDIDTNEQRIMASAIAIVRCGGMKT